MNEWTIMVYMAGDNDLSEDMAKRLIEMRTIFDETSGAIKTKRIGLCAYFDGDNPMITTKRYNFGKGIQGITIPGGRGSNSADKLTIKDFVEWCVAKEGVEAEKYALFISGHGDGFQQTSFLRDVSQSDSITVKEVKDVIEDINKTILRKSKLDLLAFDSCVMNTLEVANEFKGIVEVMVGSQGYLPTTGWSYQRIVDSLILLDKNSKEIEGEEIAAALVSAAIESNEQYSEISRRSLDMSVYYPSDEKIDAIMRELANLATVLQNALLPQSSAELESLKRKPVKKVLLNAHWKCQTFLLDQSVDIIDFCDNLRAECFGTMFQIGTTLKYAGVDLLEAAENPGGDVSEVKIASEISAEDQNKYADVLEVLGTLNGIATAALNLRNRVDECVSKCCFSGPDYQFLNGLSLFFPWSRHTFDMVKSKMDDFTFKTSEWFKFLDEYLTDTCRPPRTLLLENKLSLLGYKLLADKSMFAAFTGRVMLDPPPKGLLVTNGQYKEYFMRTKNFPLNDTGFCPKP